MIDLPASINLSDAAHAEFYSTARYVTSDTGQEFRGRPIVFAGTLLGNASNLADAERALAWLVGPDGQRLIADFNFLVHPVLAAGDIEAMPARVRTMVFG